MNQWDTFENRWEGRGDVEERLTAYYGPVLPPQPLPPTSWAHLQSRLTRSRSLRRRTFHIGKRRKRFLHIPRLAHGDSVPVFVQDTFERIAHEARVSYTAEMVRCTYKKQVRVPSVHVSYWGRRRIHLLLPAHSLHVLEPAELNVLLASGLAVYQLLHEGKLPFGLVRMLVMWACVFALLVLMCIAIGRQHFDAVVLPVALMLLAVLIGAAVVSHRRGRALAFRGDALMVQWLGRSQVCEGLHALVRRSRHPGRKGFGQISFAERIERVCGTQVPPQNERLTLVH